MKGVHQPDHWLRAPVSTYQGCAWRDRSEIFRKRMESETSLPIELNLRRHGQRRLLMLLRHAGPGTVSRPEIDKALHRSMNVAARQPSRESRLHMAQRCESFRLARLLERRKKDGFNQGQALDACWLRQSERKCNGSAVGVPDEMEAAFAAWDTPLNAPDFVVKRKSAALGPFVRIAIADEIRCNYVVGQHQPLAECFP